MATGNKSNVLVMQSGGPTAVLNRSLFGVLDEASSNSRLGTVYGAVHGLAGLIKEDIIPLERPSGATWRRIARSPGAALGSTRRKLRQEDVPVVLDALARRGIGYLFIMGGNDSAETGHGIGLAANAAGYSLKVINVPKTIDNDLVLSDHSPGYGSAARFVALATLGAGRDAEAMGEESPITVIEVMGRDAGWLAASAALAKREDRDAPHLVCIPEVPVSDDLFLGRLEDAYRRYGFAVAVVAENVRGPKGVLGEQESPWLVDSFGHPYYEGAGRYLAGLAARHLKVRVRYEKPGTIQRSFIECVSRTDAREAEMVGRAAVRYALDGHTDQIVTLVREPGDRYHCTTGLAPLERVAGQVKTMSNEYYDPSTGSVTDRFISYARPLIGSPLPRLGRVH